MPVSPDDIVEVTSLPERISLDNDPTKPAIIIAYSVTTHTGEVYNHRTLLDNNGNIPNTKEDTELS
jgi:hypothetical protein